MSRIRADQITNRLGTGSPELTYGAKVPVGVGITGEGGINITGVITATSFVGDGSALTGTGIGPNANLNTTGIITAGYFYGDGRGLTNVGGTLDIIGYSINSGSTNISPPSSVTFTFNKSIIRYGGTIEIRTGSAVGTLVSSIPVLTGTELTINGGTLTITYPFSSGLTYFIIIPANAFADVLESSFNTLVNTYNFSTSAAVGITSTVFLWGYNVYGELGLSDEVQRSSPTQLPGTQWKEYTNVSHSSFGIRNDGTLWAWGHNGHGQLGQNNVVYYDSPVQIPGNQWDTFTRGNNFKGSFMSGAQTIFVKKTTGQVWGWGYNGHGQLGFNETTPRSSPVLLFGGDVNWDQISLGAHYSVYGIKNDTTMWSWGYNHHGSLGQNNNGVHRSSPVQIPGTGWTDVRSGYEYAHAIRNDTLWTWGYNGHGQLGHNSVIPRSSPVQVPGTNWDMETIGRASVGYNQCHYLKPDNTMWSWGNNPHSVLGILYDGVHRSSPTLVPGVSWNRVGLGYYCGFGVATNGTAYSWGHNPRGQLGLNDTIPRSSPTQIPGTNWFRFGAAGHHSSIGVKTSL